MDRSRHIIRVSAVGVAINLTLSITKAVVGLAANSIAVLLDAVNNLSDALSAIITIVGTKLSGRRPDKKHPYGYGRIEYITSTIIALIVLLAGAASLRESIGKTIHPEAANYTGVSLLVILIAVCAKLFLGCYVGKAGREINSGALIAAGMDAFLDAALSCGTLLAAGTSILWGWQIEGVVGMVISIVIIKAGIGMLKETLGTIIGIRIDTKLAKSVKKIVARYPEVLGVFDLSLHSYGPTELIGSASIEVPDEMTARELHYLTRKISKAVYQELNVTLTLGVYATGDSSELLTAVRDRATEFAVRRKEILQLHGFYCDEAEKTVFFDMIVDFEADAAAVCAAIRTEMENAFPGYRFDVTPDSDYSD